MRCLWQALLYICAVPASTPLDTVSPSYLIDLLLGVTTLSLPGLTPRLSASETDFAQQNLRLSLTLCAASVWPFISVRLPLCESCWITLCLSLLMILRLRNSLSPDVIPALQLQEISSIRTSSWELLTLEIRSLDLSSVFSKWLSRPLK